MRFLKLKCRNTQVELSTVELSSYLLEEIAAIQTASYLKMFVPPFGRAVPWTAISPRTAVALALIKSELLGAFVEKCSCSL